MFDNLNWIDLFLILVVVLSVWAGLRKGFILGTLDLITWVGSLLAGFFLYRYVASYFEKHIPSLGIWTFPVAFIAVIIVARMVLFLIARTLLKATTEDTHRHAANRFLGMIPGVFNGVINATILAALFLALPLSDRLSDDTRNSKIANKLAYQVDWLDAQLSPIFDEAIRHPSAR